MNDNKNNKFNPYVSTSTDSDDVGGDLGLLRPAIGDDGSGALQASSLKGIFGIPYQFLPSVDRRIYNDDNGLGRKYAEKIMSHAPLLLLTPCRQKFMEDFSNDSQRGVIDALISGDSPDSAVDSVGRYYTAEFAVPEYYRAVNHMCSEVAHFLGIADKNFGGETIGEIDWSEHKNDAFASYFALKRSVVFYADGLVSLQDSFGNSTTESSLASSINSFGDNAKELRFLLGNNESALGQLYESGRESISNITEALGKLGEGFAGGLLGDLASTGVNVAMAGGKMIFPKLWGDSQSSRSYSFDIKLRSPDHDDISIFMNILVPYLHLLALCLPQSITESSAAQSPNAYDTPFLVRAYCKGMFNINMGIITDLSCTRGAEAQWNNSGLPTQMDVSISIEDLYSSLVMSNMENGSSPLDPFDNFIDVVTNTEMIDFLSNLSGLNVAAGEVDRRMKLITYLMGADAKRFPRDIYLGFENGVSNMVRRIYDKIY